MAHKLITSVRKADRILKNVNFIGNFNIFAQAQPKRLELKLFLSQLSSHPPKGFDKSFNPRKESDACMAGGITMDRNSSSLSGGADGREGDEEKSKVGPGSGGKNNSLSDRSNIGSKWADLAKVLEKIDETVEIIEKISNLGKTTYDENEKKSVPAHLAQLVNAAKSTDPQIRWRAVNSVCNFLSSGRNPPVGFLIRCDILPTLVDCLSSPNRALQLDALFALTRIVAGTSKQAQAVVEAGAVPHFLRFLTSPDQNIRKNAFSAFGGIIGKGPQLRDCVINLGVVAPLLNRIQPDTPINFLRRVAYVISILCLHWGKPLPPQTVREILPTLNVLVHHNDPFVVLVTSWALKNLTEGGKEQIQMVIDSGVLPKLVQLRNHRIVEVQEVAARAIWNILTGADDQIQSVLNCDVLSQLHNLLNPKETTCKGALTVLAMVVAKKFATVQAIIDAGLIPLIVHHLEKGEFETQKAAALVVNHMSISGNKEQVAHLIECGVIPLLCTLWNSIDSVLQSHENMEISNIVDDVSINIET